MTDGALETIYRRYIECLNARRLDEMDRFYHDAVLYNGNEMTRDQWRRDAIEASFLAMPDLQWRIEHLVVAGADLAARLVDSGTLAREWQGLRPSGRSVRFGENVFYRFRDARVFEVWSIADLRSIAMQLGG